MFQSLDKACQNFAVASELHALVLLTPLEGVEPNWERFREEYLACSKDDPVRVIGRLVRRQDAKCCALSVCFHWFVRWWHHPYYCWWGATRFTSCTYVAFRFERGTLTYLVLKSRSNFRWRLVDLPTIGRSICLFSFANGDIQTDRHRVRGACERGWTHWTEVRAEVL